tara:strand:- start:747 stop:1049 length:303 start_codon:yes stop_codon:yes gene_type:complete
MSWEDIIKNVRDTPMGDMEQYERDALSSEKEDGRQLTEGNIRANRIAAKMAVKEINELRDRLDKVVEECEDGINRVINNEVDAKYAEKLLEGIRKTALGR